MILAPTAEEAAAREQTRGTHEVDEVDATRGVGVLGGNRAMGTEGELGTHLPAFITICSTVGMTVEAGRSAV